MRKPRNKIAYLRMTKIWSQYDMARMLGISQSYYARLERRPTDMSVEMALKLKELLNVPTIDSMLEAI